MTGNQGKPALTPEQVRKVRDLHANWKVSMRDLAGRFGVSHHVISDVVHRRNAYAETEG